MDRYLVFQIFMWGTLILTGLMFCRVLRGPDVFDRLNGIFVISTNVIILFLLVGYENGRMDMYVDIALSYALLGFISTIVIAGFIGERQGKEQV